MPDTVFNERVALFTKIGGSLIAIGIFVAGAAHLLQLDPTLGGSLLGAGLIGLGVSVPAGATTTRAYLAEKKAASPAAPAAGK